MQNIWSNEHADLLSPRFYCQPKVQKPAVTTRLIASYSGSPLHNPNKFITNALKAYVNNAKNSTMFSKFIRNVPIESNIIMLLFNDTSLSISVPIVAIFNLMMEFVNKDDKCFAL